MSIICVLALFAGTVSAAAQTSRKLDFPSTDSTWESVTPESLDWNVAALEDACRFVENTNGKSFLILGVWLSVVAVWPGIVPRGGCPACCSA